MKTIIKVKIGIKAVLVVIVALAFILPTSAVVPNNGETSKEKGKPLFLEGAQQCSIKSMKSSKGQSGNYHLSEGDDVKISAEDYAPGGNDTIPAVTKDDKGNVVFTWTNDNTETGYNLGLTYSSFPVTEEAVQAHWVIIESLSGTTEINDLADSDIAFIKGLLPGDYSGLYGTFLGIDVGAENAGEYIIPDVTGDPTDQSYAQFFTWTSGAPEATYASVVDSGYYHEPHSNYDGPVNMYVYHFTEQGYDIIGCPSYVNYNIRGGEGAESTFYFDGQTRLKSAPASDPDLACLDGRFHLTWQYHNSTPEQNQIIWKKIDPAVEADIEYTAFQKYVAVGTHPAIAGDKSGKIAIVYMTGNGKVNCTYSGNEGDTWTTTTIANGTYPDIYARKGKFYVAYINNGNLSLVNSTDGGATWNTPTRINDVDGTVVAEENAVDLHEGGIVWVDSRNGGEKIYYQQIFVPEPEPKLEISLVHGLGLGVKAIVKNNGTAAATNVVWDIKVTGGILGIINKDVNDTIPTLAAGDEKTVSTGIIIGLGTITAAATATCDEGKTASPDSGEGTQLFILSSIK